MTRIVNEATYQNNFLSSLRASNIVDQNYEVDVLDQNTESRFGYDAEIDFDKVGIPVFLQFKISKQTTQTRKNNVLKELNSDTSKLNHRMILRRKDNFLQHQKLMKIDKKNTPTAVYYATPNYETNEEYRAAIRQNYLQYKSTFLSPQEIGKIPTSSAHEINYFLGHNNALLYPKNSKNNTYKVVNTYTFDDVIDSINKKLTKHDKNLGITINKILKKILGERYKEEMKKLEERILVDQINKSLEQPSSPRPTHLKYFGVAEEDHYSTFTFDMTVLKDGYVINLYKLNYLQNFSRTSMGAEVVIFYQKH